MPQGGRNIHAAKLHRFRGSAFEAKDPNHAVFRDGNPKPAVVFGVVVCDAIHLLSEGPGNIRLERFAPIWGRKQTVNGDKELPDLPSVRCGEGTYPHGPLTLRRFDHAESS